MAPSLKFNHSSERKQVQQQSRRENVKTGGLAVAPQRRGNVIGAVEPVKHWRKPGPTSPSYTRASLLGTSPALLVEPRPAYVRPERGPLPTGDKLPAEIRSVIIRAEAVFRLSAAVADWSANDGRRSNPGPLFGK